MTPTQSLSERLRKDAAYWHTNSNTGDMLREAADAIDAKDAIIAQAAEALEWISVGKHSTVNNFAKDAVRRARVALAAIREVKP